MASLYDHQPPILTDEQQEVLDHLNDLCQHDFKQCLEVVVGALLGMGDAIASSAHTSIEDMKVKLKLNCKGSNRCIYIGTQEKDSGKKQPSSIN